MKFFNKRVMEQVEVIYQDSEVDALIQKTMKQNWMPTGTPQPVHRLILQKVLGKPSAINARSLDIMNGWNVVRLQRPIKRKGRSHA